MIGLIKEYLLCMKDLLFPRLCLACGKALESDERHLCPECFDDMPLTHFWDWSGNPAEVKMGHRVGIEAAASLFYYRYDSAYHDITPAIKYRGEIMLGYRMGRMLGEYLHKSGRFDTVQAVVPVPLHPSRLFTRGYNQAEVIARGIAASLESPVVCNLLKRLRKTSTQTKLTGDSKRRNLEGAFAVDADEASRLAAGGVKHILLIDDVLTSGATLEASTSVLLPYFSVSIATLGYVE